MTENQPTKTALDALKMACQKKNYQSFKDMQPGEYVVRRFNIVDTTHGKRIRIELDGTYMYLPERFVTMLTDDVINVLNKSPKIMVYGGKDTSNRDRLILDFHGDSYFGEGIDFDMQ